MYLGRKERMDKVMDREFEQVVRKEFWNRVLENIKYLKVEWKRKLGKKYQKGGDLGECY